MVYDEECETSTYCSFEPSLSFSSIPNEQVLLAEFVQFLSSSTKNNEFGNNSKDEEETRKEAQLLMSLLSLPSSDSSSSSNISIYSDSESLFEGSSHLQNSEISNLLRSSRSSFSFTCPSLSLETKGTIEEQFFIPLSSYDLSDTSELLGRTLTVDDRDALRLSSDAMSRNVLKSFQTAIASRVQTWIWVLGSRLLSMENDLLLQGTTPVDLKVILKSSEATLIAKLHAVGMAISVTEVKTSFHVLPEKIESGDDFDYPDVKRQRIGVSENPKKSLPFEDEDDYHYSVSYRLKFQCIINLTTPAGFSEITIDVPGHIKGTFLSSSQINTKLSSVQVHVDTCILAAMLDKSCRTLVRTSVEACLGDENDKISCRNLQLKSTEQASEHLDCSKNPTPESLRDSFDHDILTSDRPGFVTPTVVRPEENYNQENDLSLLMPIPDDLIDSTPRSVVLHRVSPQLSCHKQSLSSKTTQRSRLEQKKAILPRPSPGPSHTPHLESNCRTHSSAQMTSSYRLPMISPPVNEGYFRDIICGEGPYLPAFSGTRDTSPSLPMLIEAASRALKSG